MSRVNFSSLNITVFVAPTDSIRSFIIGVPFVNFRVRSLKTSGIVLHFEVLSTDVILNLAVWLIVPIMNNDKILLLSCVCVRVCM